MLLYLTNIKFRLKSIAMYIYNIYLYKIVPHTMDITKSLLRPSQAILY